MKIKKMVKTLEDNLSDDELLFYDYISKEIKNFNNVYLLTRRFIDRVDEITELFLKVNNIKIVNKFHYYVGLGFKFKIILKENRWEKNDYVDYYKELINNTGVAKDVIYDREIEAVIKNNDFYYLMFVTKFIKNEGVENE